MNLPVIIAIDGPAASGKSSVARSLAKHLDYRHINSGIFYRSITWWTIENKITFKNLKYEIGKIRFTYKFINKQLLLEVDGRVIEDELVNSFLVNRDVAIVSAIQEVRSFVTAALKSMVSEGTHFVIEGRDIGTVVFPDTSYKVYLNASLEVRQHRRAQQGIRDEIAARDSKDESRHHAPLVAAFDAVQINTDEMNVQAVVAFICNRFALRD